MKIDPNIYLCC